VDINIYQGERELAKDCRSLGKFRLSGIPPMPAQLAQVDVTFLVDANGLLTVTAREQRSGKEARVTVQPSHGLTDAEVENLVLESIEHARTDFTARRFIELKNKTDTTIRHTEKAMTEAGAILTEDQRQRIDRALTGARNTMQGTDVDRLQEAADELGAATLPLAELIMNRVVNKTLQDKHMDEVNPEKL
jgi:molecular chaperone DnaK